MPLSEKEVTDLKNYVDACNLTGDKLNQAGDAFRAAATALNKLAAAVFAMIPGAPPVPDPNPDPEPH